VKEIVLHPWRRIVTEYSLWRLARMRRLFVLNVIAWISLSTAIAQGGQSRDPCAGDSTQSAMTECANRALTAANAKLDKTYRRILASTDSSRRRLLQSAEAAWEKYRVAHCTFTSSYYAGGTMEGEANLLCLADEASERERSLRREDKFERH